MSKEEDQKFIQLFSIVIAALVAIAIGILALSIGMGERFAETDRRPYSDEAIVERIQPPGQVTVRGAAAPPSDAPAAPVAAADNGNGSDEADDGLGERIYNQACTACHTAGIAGAPATDDTEEWARRMEKGRDTLIEHSIDGFTGDAGFMPPRGGQAQLSDEEVIAALDYMLERSGN